MEPVPLTDLVAALGGTPVNAGDQRCLVRRVCTDSRGLRPGDLFWALRGARHDGHEFVEQALRRGAVAAVVERAPPGQMAGPLILVPDTLAALGRFARWYRQQRDALVIGITGSVGKTTAREVLHAVLAARYAGCRSRENFNNEIGLPLSLLELAAHHDYGVFELGAARPGDIRALCEIAAPEVGVLTRLGPAHLATFGSLEAIYATKAELLEALPAAGLGVVWADDEPARGLVRKARCPVVTVGESPASAVRAEHVSFSPGRLEFFVEGRRYELAAPARHYLVAALCALAVAREIGMTPEDVARGLSQFSGAPGRCQVERLDELTIIDDTYNASPLSMQAACVCLRDWPTRGQRLLIVGDMLELGGDAPRWHQELGAHVARSGIDRLLALGEQAEMVARGALEAGMSAHQVAACDALESLLAVLDCWVCDNDVVLVKGSRAMHMERVVAWLRQDRLPPGKRATLSKTTCAVA